MMKFLGLVALAAVFAAAPVVAKDMKDCKDKSCDAKCTKCPQGKCACPKKGKQDKKPRKTTQKKDKKAEVTKR